MKTEALLTLQTKGQIMLPKEWRDEHGAKIYQAVKDGDIIILKPLHISSEKEILKTAAQIIQKKQSLIEIFSR